MRDHHRNIIVFALSLLIAVSAACSSSKMHGPTRRVILVQGACSSSQLNTEPDHWLQTVTSLLTDEYGFTDTKPGDPADQVIEFGYSDAGWDKMYAPVDTLKSVPESSAGLEAIFEYYPDSKFFILGHSLGGIVALDGIARFADAENHMIEQTGGIVTVSSPVQGLEPTAATSASYLIELLACRQAPTGDRSQVWNDLEFTGQSISLIREFDWSGVRVVNFANMQDRVVNWQTAILQPQFVAVCLDATNGRFFDVNHDTLLRDPGNARKVLAALIDAELQQEVCDDA